MAKITYASEKELDISDPADEAVQHKHHSTRSSDPGSGKKGKIFMLTLVCAECFAVLDEENTKKHADWHDQQRQGFSDLYNLIDAIEKRTELQEARIPHSKTRTRVIERGIAEALEILQPQVVRIRYDVEDQIDFEYPLIDFRVLLSDSAALYINGDDTSPLFWNVHRAEQIIEEHVRPREIGLLPMWNFRSESEQNKLKEKTWE